MNAKLTTSSQPHHTTFSHPPKRPVWVMALRQVQKNQPQALAFRYAMRRTISSHISFFFVDCRSK
mgnify:CR=1 FL=1